MGGAEETYPSDSEALRELTLLESDDEPASSSEARAAMVSQLDSERITAEHEVEAIEHDNVAGTGVADACNVPAPGTAEFAAECRELDSRPMGYRVIKRAFDVAFSACVCAAGLIPGVLLCVAIAAETKGSPLYSQERVGRCGRPIRLLKFRTMVADADDVERWLTPEQLAEWHRERKVTGDPRITRLGAVLRKTSLDEMAQFVNVLAGDLSVIGPRVITYEELGNFAAGDQCVLLSVPQGITGAWQAGPRNEATFENGERQRVELDYARHASLGRDVGIFFSTFSAMFGKNKTGR